MRKNERTKAILRKLHELYPETDCTLDIDEN
ncbi:MAG TPA: endonuclease III, partial [Clostridiales bacterium]|nr:endonuclease III [Clostridiales bacterium]